MNAVENTCRTCGKLSEQEDGADLYPMYTSTEYSHELRMIQEEFDIWNLNISQGDGLPQKICLTCFDSFCQIHNFRMICQEAQMNFGELCTGLDIIIKLDSNFDGTEVDFPEDYEGEQTITVHEHYQFPGGQRSKIPDGDVEEEILISNGNNCEGIKQEIGEDGSTQIKGEIFGLPEIKRYQCEYCMDLTSFDDPEMLNKHYNIFHTSDTPYPCPRCDKSFNKKNKRNSHARVHFPVVIDCEICGKKIRGGRQMMAQHNELHHIEKDRECTTCGKKFHSITLKRFNYHLSWHDESKLHKCKYCEKKFIQINHLVVHERTHTGESPFICSECGAGFKNSGMLNNHMKMHGGRELECPDCDKKFFYSHGLRNHMKIHDPNRKLSHCEFCEKTFSTTLSLSLHLHKRHGEPATPALLDVLKRREMKRPYLRPYKCGKCRQSYPTHKQLVKHLRTHDENRPYKCDRCTKTFKREAHLKLHINSLHLNKKPFKCTLCDYACIQRSILKEHIASRHEDKRDFKCEICGKAFAIAKTLRTHVKRHGMEKEIFTCRICKKTFRQLGILKWHMNSHKKQFQDIAVEETEADIAAREIADIVVHQQYEV